MSHGVDLTAGELVGMQIGVTSTFGAASVALAYQDDNHDGIDGDGVLNEFQSGELLGVSVGNMLGEPVGRLVGKLVGVDIVGWAVGVLVVGFSVGCKVGPTVGSAVGLAVGFAVGMRRLRLGVQHYQGSMLLGQFGVTHTGR